MDSMDIFKRQKDKEKLAFKWYYVCCTQRVFKLYKVEILQKKIAINVHAFKNLKLIMSILIFRVKIKLIPEKLKSKLNTS